MEVLFAGVGCCPLSRFVVVVVVVVVMVMVLVVVVIVVIVAAVALPVAFLLLSFGTETLQLLYSFFELGLQRPSTVARLVQFVSKRFSNSFKCRLFEHCM